MTLIVDKMQERISWGGWGLFKNRRENKRHSYLKYLVKTMYVEGNIGTLIKRWF